MKHVVLATLLIFLACKAEKASVSAARVDEASTGARSLASPVVANASAPPAKALQPQTRMIIRNATMSLVVRDAASLLQQVTTMVDAKGGYVSDTRQWKEREQVRATVTLRIPSTELMPLLAAIRGLAVRVDSETVNAQDVSQEYSDLNAQLRNLQATETELRELLKTVRERTQKASEIMEIFGEITKVRGQIDQIQARIQYFSQATTLSTVNLELVPDALAQPVVEPGWQPVVTIRNASRSLLISLKGLVDVLIWLALYLLPLGLIFVVVALLVRVLWRWIQKARQHP